MAFNFFTSRVEQYVIDMNDVSSEFIDYVLREGRGVARVAVRRRTRAPRWRLSGKKAHARSRAATTST